MKTRDIISRSKASFLLIDPQTSFVESAEVSESLLIRTRSMLQLCTAYSLPTVVTVENPIESKGVLPAILEDAVPSDASRFNKNTFDCLSEGIIKEKITTFNRPQILVAGCETDVCVMQTCLHLLSEGYTVFLVDDICFTSTKDDRLAKKRLSRAGVVFVTYKMVYYELLRSVDRDSLEGGTKKRLAECGAVDPD